MLTPSSRAAKPKPPLSEWEIIRRQLRGEKVKPAAAPAEQHHQHGFQDTLLATLAEHGKNFRALGDKEKITIAITFRPWSAPEGGMPGSGLMLNPMGPSGAPGPMGGVPGDPEGGGPFNPAGGGPSAGGSGPGGLAGPPVGGLPMPGVPGGAPPRTGSKDHELLADYHLKQGRYHEAVKSFLKAIALNTDQARVSGLQRKLAVAYLMLDQEQGDASATAKALEAIKKALEGRKSSGAPPQVQPVILPQRLIISTSRSALQQASPAGLDDFRKQATVEWLRFNASVLRESVTPAP